MGKVFEIKAGQTKQVLWLLSSSIPGQIRFSAETSDGSEPSGTVELARRRWFDWQTETHPLHARNVFDKAMSDADYRLTVTPDNDARIVFETRHFRAEYIWKILVAVLALGVLSPLIVMLVANASN